MERISRDFTTTTLALMPLAVAINIVGGQAIATLRLPVYLDSIGTVLVAALAGPWAGAATGATSNIVWGLLAAPTALPFAVTATVIGLVAGWLAGRGLLLRWWSALLGGVLTGVIAAVVSAPIAAYLFGGITGGGTDVIVAFFLATGSNILQASLGQGIVSDPLDKGVTFLLIWAVLRGLPRRLIGRFPRWENVVPRG